MAREVIVTSGSVAVCWVMEAAVQVGVQTCCLKVSYSVPVTMQHPLGGHQSLLPHRTSGVDPASTDPDLCTQTKPVAIRESSTGIVEDAGTVHSRKEGVSSGD